MGSFIDNISIDNKKLKVSEQWHDNRVLEKQGDAGVTWFYDRFYFLGLQNQCRQ